MTTRNPAGRWRRLTRRQRAVLAVVVVCATVCAGLVTLSLDAGHRYQDRVHREEILGQGAASGDGNGGIGER
ncbi:hypothetical protein ACWCHM_15985 [Micromonospora sp. SCSIO 07396]